ncbi:sulfurtransferase complex subunit TusB [Blochmannia endosymbiont of Colobopsis nipponica]|uniref:sulfurtransferase complex subunit TusB n=1 Tax=Blochmannia endosymbiont of Colobopsis nipponica TaxID=2681987 RepID=UPI00177E8EE6|nr:sulfurtransferase complex subunit TusB [Blochmannia endosymbiont of Colobopsis nipponica]QOI10908.1 sulfurtransferase complex subunit TusB [Blochmannia endosymbiont of Colobopsis nipponica]
MLYTLSSSPYKKDLFLLSKIIRPFDELLLLSDGIIAGLVDSVAFDVLNKIESNIYGLKDDILSRGLLFYFSKEIIIIDYLGFVQLTERHSQQMVW